MTDNEKIIEDVTKILEDGVKAYQDSVDKALETLIEGNGYSESEAVAVINHIIDSHNEGCDCGCDCGCGDE